MPSHLPSRRVLIGAACLLVIHAYATPLARAPKTAGPLSVTLKVPPTVSDVSKFTIELTLKNTGDKDLNVVRDPSGPLFEGLAIDAWDWELAGGTKKKVRATPAKDKTKDKTKDKDGKDKDKDKDGKDKDKDGKDKDKGKPEVLPANTKEPEFIGAYVAWTIESYLSKTTPALGGKDGKDSKDGKKDEKVDKDTKKEKRAAEKASKKMISLKKGASTKITYQVGSAYDFTKSGAGTYSLKLARETLWITFDKGKTTQEVKVTVPKQSVKISGKLAGKAVTTTTRREVSTLDKRAVTTEECSEAQIGIIELSAAAADDYADESYTYLTTDSTSRARYEWWFGAWDHHRAAPNQALLVRDHVIRAYRAMRARRFVSGYSYDCDCEFDVIAFVVGAKYNEQPKPVINLCNLYWGDAVPNSGHNSRAGTLVHEASHFHDVAKSEDHEGYRDMAGTHALAANVPEVAAQSANNYRFFSENRDNRD